MELDRIIIIADSGSSKTDWRIYNHKHAVVSVQTIGLNPYFVDSKKVREVLDKELVPFIDPLKVVKVYFYGSGCTALEKVQEIESPLTELFRRAEVSVLPDMLGTARALCAMNPGLVGIIGTGSNSCLYDGNAFISQINSMGFILGDEGSGAVLGIAIVKAFFEYTMPQELQEDFKERYLSDLDKTLDRIYKQPFPNRFLASYAPFASLHRTHPWMDDLLNRHFEQFFKHMVMVHENYNKYKLFLSGSVCFHFREYIEKIAAIHSIEIGGIVIQPIDELLKYHLHALQEQRQ